MSKWEELYEGDIEKMFATEQTYHLKKGEYDFDYKYVVDFVQPEENVITAELYLVPLFKELHNDHKEMIQSLYDMESFCEEGALYNVTTEFACPIMFNMKHSEEDFDLWEKNGNNFIAAVLKTVTEELGMIDKHKEDYLDNNIETIVIVANGWDMLNYMLFNKKIKPTKYKIMEE